MEQQRADALALLAETALHHGMDPGAPGERYQVVVHVDAAVLADAEQPGQSVLEDGVRVPAETSQRLACDASRVVMRHDADGRVWRSAPEPGRFRRPYGARSTIVTRDAASRAAGAVRPGPSHPSLGARAGPRRSRTSRCSAGAIIARSTRRATASTDSPTASCSSGDRTGGVPDVPPTPAVPDDPVAALFSANVAHGLHIDAQTARPGWLGERLDVGWAIDVLHPRANPGIA